MKLTIEKIKELRQPLTLKWKPQSCNQYGAVMVAYIDARDQMDLLDNVCSPENWFDEYLMIGERLICKLSIRIENEWVAKCDAGADSKVEKEKGGVSDAFKRAGVKWGINRQAYDTEPVRLKSKEYKNKWYPVDDNGAFLKGRKLHDICNTKSKKDEN